METVNVPACIEADFVMIYKGDGMINARIFDGDLVYIRQQDELVADEIAVVAFNGETIMGRVRFGEGCIVLEPANPMYRPVVIYEDDMENVDVIGKAVAFTSLLGGGNPLDCNDCRYQEHAHG